MPKYNTQFQTAYLFLAVVVLVVFSGCNRSSPEEGSESNQYGFYANDPSVDLKRRDVLPRENPLPAKEALSTFEVADGFRVELFAAEPLVKDPVDMAVDAAGRIYVVELHSYPDKENASKVKLLTDTDGDGRPDESTVFADRLHMPKGVMAWKGGVLVTDPPEVLYLKDTDGDGRADRRKVVLSGFKETNPQLGVNDPVYGLDNWVYLAQLAGKDSVRFAERSGQTYEVGGNVRFRPDAYKLEGLAAGSQFGHTFDAWGRHLLNTNSNHIYQKVMAGRYLKRNPDLLVSSTTEIISDHGASAKMYPITPDQENRLGKAGGITSASGLTSYQGRLFPSPYQGVTFIGAPIYSAVHVDKLTESGAALTASRIQEKKEFLASTDRWFRPVNFHVGPDGALYVLDYYRRVLEQPKFLTKEVLKKANLYSGSDRGRIYRIVPEGGEGASWMNNLQLDEAPPKQLVQMLERRNIWWRRTAQRLLVSRQPEAAVEPLERLAKNSALPEARLHALWSLEGLDALEPALIKGALRDEAAGVRENAIQLAERHLEEVPSLAEALVAMGTDPDPSVRHQLLLTLGSVSTEPARELRRQLLFENVESKWMQLAAISAASPRPVELFDQAARKLSDKKTERHQGFFRRLGALVGASGQEGNIRQMLRRSTEPSSPESYWWRSASLMGLAEGMEQQDVATASMAQERSLLLDRFFETEAAPMRGAYLKMLGAVGLPAEPSKKAALKKAVKAASDEQANPEMRADAIRLLEMTDPSAYVDLLKQLMGPQKPAPVQKAAVRALNQIEGKKVGSVLLANWNSMTPAVRREAISVMLDDRERLFMLFDAVEAGKVSPSAVPRPRAEDLVEHENDKIRRRANKVLRREAGERQEVIATYQAALKNIEGDPRQGRKVFQRVCSRCHQVDGEGRSFGPDLATLKNRPPGWLLQTILAPNKVIAEGYNLLTIERQNGEPVAGIITSETPTSVTVRDAGGQETVISRQNIQSMKEAGASAMPVGLESQISKQEMADLVEYLMSIQTVN